MLGLRGNCWIKACGESIALRLACDIQEVDKFPLARNPASAATLDWRLDL